MTQNELIEEVERLQQANRVLRRTISIQNEQLRRGGMSNQIRRLRAKLAEWEDSSQLMNGGYYHGSKFILPFRDWEDDE